MDAGQRQRVRRGAFRRSVAVMAMGMSAVTACGSDDPKSTQADGSRNGASLYAVNCASCHGSDLRGTEKGPSHLSVVYEPNHHPDASFQRAIELGVQAHHWQFGDMAPIPGLDRAEIDAIIAYVRSIQDREGFEEYPPE